jgi:hypothetical protein
MQYGTVPCFVIGAMYMGLQKPRSYDVYRILREFGLYYAARFSYDYCGHMPADESSTQSVVWKTGL